MVSERKNGADLQKVNIAALREYHPFFLMTLEHKINEILRRRTIDSFYSDYSYKSGECCLTFTCEGGGPNEDFSMKLTCSGCVALHGILYAHAQECVKIKIVEDLPKFFENDLDEGYVTIEVHADDKKFLSATCFEVKMS